MSVVQVFFTPIPEEVMGFENLTFFRKRLRKLSLRVADIQFDDFESNSEDAVKSLTATVGARSTDWTLSNGVWDFHEFRRASFDCSQVIIYWEMICRIHVDKDSHQILYCSRQTFADFERAILSSLLVRKLAAPVIIEVVDGVLFTEELLRDAIARNQRLDLFVRSEHASYSQLKARYVLPKFDFHPRINPIMQSDNGPAEISALFRTFTSSPDPEFTAKVKSFADIMLEMNGERPFGLFLGFEYLRFVRSSFPDSPGIDWNETQRRTICDPLMYTIAAILSRKIHEEIDVWPKNRVPQDATGHGPLDYYLPGPSALLGHKTRKRDREEGEEEEGDQHDTEGEESIFGQDIMSEKKTSSSVESSLAQVLAQALDTMREGSLPDLDREGIPRSNRRFCVLSTGQRYYFLRVDWDGTAKPLVTFLELYRFRYFPSRHETNSTSNKVGKSSKRSSSDLGLNDTFSLNEYVNVLAAFFVCILDGKGETDLKRILLEAAERYETFKSTDPVHFYYSTLKGKKKVLADLIC